MFIARVIKPEESVIYKGEIYTCGEEFEVDEAIGKSLIERGYIQAITDNESLFTEDEVMDVTDIAEATEEGVVVMDDIESMSYPKLKSYASKLGLSASGTKEELIERINSYMGNLEEADAEEVEESDELPDTSMPE